MTRLVWVPRNALSECGSRPIQAEKPVCEEQNAQDLALPILCGFELPLAFRPRERPEGQFQVPLPERRERGLWGRGFANIAIVAKQPCANRAEWRMQGKAPVRLSSYYQLGCDYGTALMISWENGGTAPIYLCESHANEVRSLGKHREPVLAMMPQSVPSKDLSARPRSSVPSSTAADAQVGLEEHLAVSSPASDLTSGDSAKVLADETIANVAREDFEAYGTVLRSKSSTATEETPAERSGERLCVSGFELCSYEATVHCPKCRRWFCDAHAEDDQWHPCARPKL